VTNENDAVSLVVATYGGANVEIAPMVHAAAENVANPVVRKIKRPR
jgi:hypothetical protein